MKSVVVKGITLTEGELKEAFMNLKETFEPGDIVKYIGGHPVNKELLVVAPSVAEAHRAYWTEAIGPTAVVLVGLTDGNSYSPLAKFITKVR